MKKVREIKEVYTTIRVDDKLLIIGYPDAVRETVDFVSLTHGGIYRKLNQLILFSKTTFESINVYNTDFELLDKLPELNLSYSFIYNNNLFLPSKITKTHHIYDGYSLIDSKELKKANCNISNKLFRIMGNDMARYDIENNLLWQKDLSLPEYGVFKDIDGKVYPNKINSPAMADTDTIYLSMAGGQLIALNAEDGSTKWILEGEKKGKCVLYKNLIYKNTGNHLIVIDTDKPQEIKRVSYKDYKDNSSGMTGEFNVYEDVIVMKNQIDENVVVIDRHTLKMIDFVHLKYGIKNSSANCTVWYNNQLYAIDTSDVMHIYELE